MLFLESFWKGELTPGEGRYRPNKAYSDALRTMEGCEGELKEILTGEAWKLFRKFADAQLELSALDQCDSFAEGFRMGAKAMMDVFIE